MDGTVRTMVFLMFIYLSSVSIKADIPLGSSLSPNGGSNSSFWVSPSGVFAFGFYKQDDGFGVGIWLAGVKNDIVVWSANRGDPPLTSNATLQLSAEGIELVDQGQGKLIANANATTFYASMNDSGNFVLYNKESNITWQSFDYPTNTILGGQTLRAGGQLVSSYSYTNHSTGQYHLKMQDDGNLVLYPLNTDDEPVDAYWSSGTSGFIGSRFHLYLNKTGMLVIRNGSDLNLNAIKYLYGDSFSNNKDNQTIYRATLGYDGFFRLYVHFKNGDENKLAYWPNGNACAVKAFCGFNSYCTFSDDQPYCQCLQGFDYIDPNEGTLGCNRNFSEGECSGEKDNAASYNMVYMRNINWGDHAYSEAIMSREEECSSSCLADCNCWAAIYEGGVCKKQEPPLRYVNMTIMVDNDVTTITTTAFLKVGNISLDHKPVPDQTLPTIKTTSSKAIMHIILVISGFTFLLCLTVAISSHFIHKIRVLRYKRLVENRNLGLNEEVALRRFSYSELKRATKGFKEELGKGSFGAVYKGSLYKGKRLIAVKRLEKLVEDGEREFQAEMRAIGKTHHRNLVHLFGYCAEGSKRLLVYEYMSNSSLGKLIFGDGRLPEWNERVRIALNIARGILYLHEECEAPIIHCDIKPQNILMDEFWTAKISDFGLAKLLMPDQTRTFTVVRGTRGYMAPEWNKNIPISVKADIYSYGIVLLEIICCRRNFEVNLLKPEEILLSDWVYKCFIAGELNKLVLWEDVDIKIIESMVKVALWCIQDDPVIRPTMKSVVLMLEGVTNIAIPPCPTSS
ncbi:hypothetical protein TanjilG_26250 [Lupinus angustifolius]|uniref:Receptor-like serine/threonine-protein kinase n=1 Tax=Lupinus angustifolius TaxID=3871 RepID=A0A4P1R2I0_LUPAN|nr:PREDICTED: G-type lectin S-receptor-like serine/threonine-protein kinase LECRK3 [Lupinus angustifolius]OIV99912.1 hypothetical protein TanjilG_26250 [Lupinus angustifolius]